ncbi:MAG: hypothetical protein KDD62_01845 [Bdellovibrionales bacterium]|nr:hypothetical protein [Bdellovibrionales bacterium]
MSSKKKSAGISEKERQQAYKSLVSILTNHGYTIRREKLRQGFGWKAHSGSCIALEQQLVFIDSRMPLDDQIAFLIAKLLNADIQASPEELEDLPVRYSEQLLQVAA